MTFGGLVFFLSFIFSMYCYKFHCPDFMCSSDVCICINNVVVNREVATLSRLQHQHVVRYYQVISNLFMGFLFSALLLLLQARGSTSFAVINYRDSLSTFELIHINMLQLCCCWLFYPKYMVLFF